MRTDRLKCLPHSTVTNSMGRLSNGFTVVEILVSVAVLVVLVLFLSRLFSSAAAVTAAGNKRMDSDAQIRPLFDRMAVDFAQMVKRSDVDYYLKSSTNPQPGNDQIASFAPFPVITHQTGHKAQFRS